MRSAAGTIGTAPSPLALQQLKLAPAIVTPNGDGRGDSATITYRLTAPALVTASVVDSFGDTVGTLFSQRKTAGTQSFVWSSVALPDGRYRLVLAAKDDRGTQVQTTRPISVDRTLASFATSVAAVSPNRDGRLDTLAFSFRLNAPAHVQLRILRAGTPVATPFDADLQAGAQRVDWDGGGLRDGRYSAVVVATDALLTVKQSVFVRVDTKPPVLQARLVTPAAVLAQRARPADRRPERARPCSGGQACRLFPRRSSRFDPYAAGVPPRCGR